MTEIGYDAGDRGEPEYPEQHECSEWDGDFIEASIWCVECSAPMYPDEILRRLNATGIVLANLRVLTHRDLEDGIHEQLADILEGK